MPIFDFHELHSLILNRFKRKQPVNYEDLKPVVDDLKRLADEGVSLAQVKTLIPTTSTSSGSTSDTLMLMGG